MVTHEYSVNPPEYPYVAFLPGQAEELALLTATGKFVSHTFDGLDRIQPEEYEYAATLVTEAYGNPYQPHPAKQAFATHGMEDIWHHSVEVAGLTTIALQRMGMSRDIQLAMASAAFWHDYGKIDKYVREATDGPHVLSSEQRHAMESHSIISAVAALEAGEDPRVVVAVLMHHVFIRMKRDNNGNVIKRPYPASVTEIPEQYQVKLRPLLEMYLYGNEEMMTAVAALAVADNLSAVGTEAPSRAYRRGAERDPHKRIDLTKGELDIGERVPLKVICTIEEMTAA
jgi:hypothetical protein